MPEQISVDANEHIIVEAPVVKPFRVRFARHVAAQTCLSDVRETTYAAQ